MKHSLSQMAPLFGMDIGVGVAGFVLSIIWGKMSRTRMTKGTVRLLAIAWIGIAIAGVVMAFVM
jgi:hypothetical protein